MWICSNSGWCRSCLWRGYCTCNLFPYYRMGPVDCVCYYHFDRYKHGEAILSYVLQCFLRHNCLNHWYCNWIYQWWSMLGTVIWESLVSETLIDITDSLYSILVCTYSFLQAYGNHLVTLTVASWSRWGWRWWWWRHVRLLWWCWKRRLNILKLQLNKLKSIKSDLRIGIIHYKP